MNILYDGKIFRMQRAGGVNRYFAEVISGLPTEWHPTILWGEDLGRNAPHHPRLRVRNPLEFRPRRFRHLVDRTFRIKPAFARADVFHPTYYELSDSIQISDVKCPLIITVYDFVIARYPGMFTGAERTIRAQMEMIKRADHVICISQYTEQDLLERIPEAAGKTSVIHLATSFEVIEDTAPPHARPYFFFVGMRRGYKNFDLLLRAFAKACIQRRELLLKVAGAPFTAEELAGLQALKLSENVVNIPYPEETALRDLYRESLGLLYPSYHEGFGIPPLEAMASRTIAITSNATCLPEVVGDGGIMLDPYCEADWTDCMLRIADGKINRSQLLENGTRRVKKFSWRKCSEDHIALYDRVARLGT